MDPNESLRRIRQAMERFEDDTLSFEDVRRALVTSGPITGQLWITL